MDSSIGRVRGEIDGEGLEYDWGSVYDRLSRLRDVRKAKGRRYRLETVLLVVIWAKLCGCDRPREIAEWGKNHEGQLVQLLQLARPKLPHENTYRRILAQVVDSQELEGLVREYNQAGEHGEIYALDGKTVRGAHRTDAEEREHLVSVYDVQQGKVLAQVPVGRKENEIVQAPKALESVKIAQKVVTADAMHTQKTLAAQILDQGGDYLFPVKENQLHLYQSIQSLFAPEYPKPGFGKIPVDFRSAQKVNKGHGRIEIRTITTSEMLNSYSTWPGLGQVYRLERQLHWWRNGHCYHSSREIEYGITSLSRTQASPARLLQIRRSHWGIEVGLHYRRDVTFKEDATRMTQGHAGQIMAALNNLVLALIRQAKFHNAAQARRWFAAHLPQAFSLLITPFSRLW